MIKDPKTAAELRDVLVGLENSRKNLETAPEEELVDRANEYEERRREALPAFAKSQQEFDADGEVDTAEPGTEQPAQAEDREASPGVPLISAPDVAVGLANLSNWGPLVRYQAKEDPQEGESRAVVRATPYAFDAGTAVDTEDGRVATSQPSRLIVKGNAVAVVANDVFNQAYEKVPEQAPGGLGHDPGQQAEDAPKEPTPGVDAEAAPADPPSGQPAGQGAQGKGGDA